MAHKTVQKNDVGAKLRVTVRDQDGDLVDLSSASPKSLLLLKPDGETYVEKSASFHTDGTDGKIHYVTQTGDLDEEGIWRIQAKFTLSYGTFRTTWGAFRVLKNIA